MHYPGFDDFPQAGVVKKQMRNGGAMVAFILAGGFPAGESLMNYFARKDTPMELAVSLGSAISYIQHPASMTHASFRRPTGRRAASLRGSSGCRWGWKARMY